MSEKKREQLRTDIGASLWGRLTEEQKQLMVNTAGVIDLGREIDLEEVARFLKSDEYYN